MEEKDRGGLAFSRKHGESFTIFTSDGPVNVTITDCSYSRVRIKVKAPKHLTILRDELIKNNEQQ